jgi:cytochrome b561
MGGAMVACVGSVLKAQDTKDKVEKQSLMFYHKSFGLLAFGLLFPRLLLKFTSKDPGPVVGANSLEAIGM